MKKEGQPPSSGFLWLKLTSPFKDMVLSLAFPKLSIANAANSQDKPTEVTEENGAQNQAELAKKAKISEEATTKTALET